MKPFLFLALLMIAAPASTAAPVENRPVPFVDRERFAGTWYSLLSIPTPLDRNWVETLDIYTLRKDGNYDVRTPYRIAGNPKPREIRSGLVFPGGRTTGAMKAKFFWGLLTVDFWVVELPEDYSYAVIGHPKHDYLYILSRTPSLPQRTLDGIIARAKARGYAVEKLRSQEHPVPAK